MNINVFMLLWYVKCIAHIMFLSELFARSVGVHYGFVVTVTC